MNERIAVYLQDVCCLTSFFKSNQILIFEKEEKSHWKATKNIPFDIDATNMNSIRKSTTEIVKLLKEYDCDIIAGKELTGIPFSIFDQFKFYIFNIDSTSDELFDSILYDIENSNIQTKIKSEIIKNLSPIETDVQGVYFLDLILLQTECPEVSSKKALKNFLENTPFLELILVCKHIPPWLEENYDIKTTYTNEVYNAKITKKRCN